VPKNSNIVPDPAELRRRAEARLSDQQPGDAKSGPPRSETDTQRLLHELEVHQIELEMQNEELSATRDKMEALVEKYTDLYDFAPVGYLTLDPAGDILEANLAAASLLGLARSALLKQSFRFFVSPANRRIFGAFLKKVFEGGTREECDVILLVDGKRPFDVRIRANLFESGEACRMAVSDITEHKQGKAAAEQLAAIVKYSNDAIIGKDLDGIITSWNQGAEKIFGYTAEEMVGTSILRLIPSDRLGEENQILEKILRDESVVNFETLRRTKDGRMIEVSVTASAIKDSTGEVIGASKVARNITELKRAEADRLILNKLESTGILAGGIAHDFNNLLTVVLLNLELAEMLNHPDAELARYLDEAKKSALKTKGLTAQLLTFAEGGAPIRRPVQLSGFIQESVRLALSGSQARCEFSMAADLWPAEVDEAQMGQVLHGIALNAREAMPQGGVLRVRAENVVLKTSEHPHLAAGNYVRVSLADEGHGIQPTDLPKIFDPYFSTKQRGDRKGMGLGLTICHSIVQKHGGAIAVESVVGVGTTLQIYLPAARKLRGGEEAPVAVPQPGRVLVMEDEVAVRDAVGRTLSGMGHEVALAQDGRRAIEVYETAKLQGRRFDVVILGLTIRDGMGGRETLQQLLKLDPRAKAIAMSGHALDPVMLKPERHGFKGVLTKPFEVEELQETLSRVMGSSTASKPAP
jgi:PAS domain S-box-containing protein